MEDNVIDFVKRVAEGKIQEAEVPENYEGEFVEYVFDVGDQPNPALRQLFHMFYSAVFGNKIGIMNATNTETNKVEVVLVGLERVDDGVATWPIARILTEEEQTHYEFKQGE